MADKYPATRFGLVRHAETVWNSEKRIQGHSDSPLTPSGKQHAEKWGRQLEQYSWDHMLVSDLGRTQETAGCINIALKVSIDTNTGLREQNWGLWEGKRIANIQNQAPMQKQVAAGWAFCPPGGEDRESVWKRGHDTICRAAARWPGDTILIVTHEGMLKCLLYRLLGRQFLPSEPQVIKSGYLHLLRHDREGVSIEQINALPLL
jgi:broad specificity phosphatase PhoE